MVNIFKWRLTVIILIPSRYNLPLYWLSNQFSLVGWNTGSALVAVGLVSSIWLE
jgi:hypothetical protein